MPLVQEADETQKGVADILRVSSEIDEELAAFLVRGAAEGAVRSQLPLWRRFCCSGPPCPAWCIPPISGRDIFRRPSVCPGGVSPARHPPATGLYHQGQSHNKKRPAAAGALFWIYSAVSTGCSPSAEAWMLWMGWR